MQSNSGIDDGWAGGLAIAVKMRINAVSAHQATSMHCVLRHNNCTAFYIWWLGHIWASHVILRLILLR